MKRVIEILEKKAVLLGALAVTAVLTFFLYRVENQLAGTRGLGVFYLQVAFTENSFNAVLQSWGASGIKLFLETIWLDFLYPAAYAFCLSSATVYFIKKKEQLQGYAEEFRDILLLAPFIAALFDYSENILHIIILKNNVKSLILPASIVASIKWVLLLFSIGYLMKQYFSMRKTMRAIILRRK